jgi:formylglycine-generating enzyme
VVAARPGVRHHLSMRFGFGALVLTAAVTGRVVRVEAPASAEVIIPAGSFEMGVAEAEAILAISECKNVYPALDIASIQGAPNFCDDYQAMLSLMKPRTVYLPAYAIDRDEVSVADYRACVRAGHCSLDALVAGDERYVEDETWPMVNVTHDEAQRFCSWRHGRLPTEAEWERAARGTNPMALWPWGRDAHNDDFNHGQSRAAPMREIDRTPQPTPSDLYGDPDDSDGFAIAAPPGSFPWGASEAGVRDMAGNVAEWTADAWVHGTKTVLVRTEERERGSTYLESGYVDLDAYNPRRDGGSTSPRVVRGGSWRQPAFFAQSNLRDPFGALYEPNRRFSHIGFRCARSLRTPNP